MVANKSKERRTSARARLLRRGRIVFRGGHSAVSCILLDLSAGGARLKVGQWLAFPDTFELRIENGPARRVEVRHRAMDLTGVAFCDAA